MEYIDTAHEPVITENFVSQAAIWLHGPNGFISQIGVLWENPEVITNAELFTFVPKEQIELSRVDQVEVGYQDLIGNVYNIRFSKEPWN